MVRTKDFSVIAGNAGTAWPTPLALVQSQDRRDQPLLQSKAQYLFNTVTTSTLQKTRDCRNMLGPDINYSHAMSSLGKEPSKLIPWHLLPQSLFLPRLLVAQT